MTLGDFHSDRFSFRNIGGFGLASILGAVAATVWFLFDAAQKAVAMDFSGAIGALVLGGIVVLLLAFLTYEDGTPEIDTKCDVCGTRIRVDPAADSEDFAVGVVSSDSPNRIGIGDMSMVARSEQYKRYYCSIDCAQHGLEQPGNPVTSDVRMSFPGEVEG